MLVIENCNSLSELRQKFIDGEEVRTVRQEPCEDWYDVPSDEMTLEQARQAVKDLRKKLAECLEQEPCEDAISRQAVLDKILKFSVTDGRSVSVTGLWTEVNDLPPVTPQALEQEPCEDVIRREDAINAVSEALEHVVVENEDVARKMINKLPSVKPQQPCADAISRQAVIEITAETGALETQARVKALPPVDLHPKTGHWIPVSEKLPDKEGYYLCSVRYMYPPYNFFEPEKVKYMDDVTIQKFDGEFNIEVKAWMSLPPCYKPQESEE